MATILMNIHLEEFFCFPEIVAFPPFHEGSLDFLDEGFLEATKEGVVHIDNGYDYLIPFFVNKEAGVCFQSLKA